jgi:AraC family transcriptional regulator
MQAEQPTAPSWLGHARDCLNEASTNDLARRLDLHPAYLARAYRYATGEGMHETVRRSRVERASNLLRHSYLALADIAAASGFCDQSHMNRCFKAVLGRSPMRVRTETIAVG